MISYMGETQAWFFCTKIKTTYPGALLAISTLDWGQYEGLSSSVGELGYFWLLSLSNILVISSNKNFRIQKFFFLRFTAGLIMIHNRKIFYSSSLWSQRGFSVDSQKTHFWGSKLKGAAETQVLPSGPNLIWLVVRLDR